eukprot:6576671-Lingulodinium_polyedra.AAC.1
MYPPADPLAGEMLQPLLYVVPVSLRNRTASVWKVGVRVAERAESHCRLLQCSMTAVDAPVRRA